MTIQRDDRLFCSVRFNCHCSQTQFGDQVCLLGSTASLGNWSFSHRLTLTTSPELFPLWRTERPILLPANSEVRYKFLICREDAPLCLACRYGAAASRSLRAPDPTDRAAGSLAPLRPTRRLFGHAEGSFREIEDGSSALEELAHEVSSARQETRAPATARKGDTCLQKGAFGLLLTAEDLAKSQMCCGAVMKGEWEAAKKWENIKGVQGDRVLHVANDAVEVFDTFGAEPAVPSARQAQAPLQVTPTESAQLLSGPFIVGSREGEWHFSSGNVLFACDSAEAAERRSLQRRQASLTHDIGDLYGPSAARPRGTVCLSHRDYSSLRQKDCVLLSHRDSSSFLPQKECSLLYRKANVFRKQTDGCFPHLETSFRPLASPAPAQRTSLRPHQVPPLQLAGLSSPRSPSSHEPPHCSPCSFSSSSSRSSCSSLALQGDPSTPALAPVSVSRRRNSVSSWNGGPPVSARSPALHPWISCGVSPRKVPLSPLASDSFRSALDSMAAYYPAHGLGDLAPTALGSSPRRGAPAETASGAHVTTGPAMCAEAAQTEAPCRLGLSGAQRGRGKAIEWRETERDGERGDRRLRGESAHAGATSARAFGGGRLESERSWQGNRRNSVACAFHLQKGEGVGPRVGASLAREREAEVREEDLECEDTERHSVEKVGVSSEDSAEILLRLLGERNLPLPTVLSLALASLSAPAVAAGRPPPPPSSFLENAETSEASARACASRGSCFPCNGTPETLQAAGRSASQRLGPRACAWNESRALRGSSAEAEISTDEQSARGDKSARGSGDQRGVASLPRKIDLPRDDGILLTEAALARLEERIVQTVQAAVCTPRVTSVREAGEAPLQGSGNCEAHEGEWKERQATHAFRREEREAFPTSSASLSSVQGALEGRRDAQEDTDCFLEEVEAEKRRQMGTTASPADTKPGRARALFAACTTAPRSGGRSAGKETPDEKPRTLQTRESGRRKESLGFEAERRHVSFVRRGETQSKRKTHRVYVPLKSAVRHSAVTPCERDAADLRRRSCSEVFGLLGSHPNCVEKQESEGEKEKEKDDRRDAENDGDDERETESRDTSCLSPHASSLSSDSSFDTVEQRWLRASHERTGGSLSPLFSARDAGKQGSSDREEKTEEDRGKQEDEKEQHNGVEEEEENKEGQVKRDEGSEEHLLKEQLSSLNDQVTCLSCALFEIRREQAFSRQLLASLCGCVERALEKRQETGNGTSCVSAPRPTPRVRQRRLAVSAPPTKTSSEGERSVRKQRASSANPAMSISTSALRHAGAREDEEKAKEEEDQEGEEDKEVASDGAVTDFELQREALELAEESGVQVYALDGRSSRCSSDEELDS
ncbi:starch binding domain-containing protein [Toxoplasma gondii p89]|uniref:Starch binding domain-containing protein n=1 Tax=Toxoplasma gondii p89 TaxID=943119 RepID=A0A086K9A6_TOXGO|nr:starch binding domain-containing protein [Toxoplasma gondii p89]